MRDAPIILAPDTPAGAALEQVKGSELDAWPVADQQGLYGMLRSTELEKARANGSGTTCRTLQIRLPTFSYDLGSVHVHPDHTLSVALERMGSSGLRTLPVVSRANVHQLLGIVLVDDILHFYGVQRPLDGPETQE